MQNLNTRIPALFFLVSALFLYGITPWLMLVSLLISWGFWRVPSMFHGDSIEQKNKRLSVILILVLAAMLVFSYLMVPLFHQMCHALDIGGKVHSYNGNDSNATQHLSNIESYPVVTLYNNTPIKIDLAPKRTLLPKTGGFQHIFVITNKLNKPLAVRLKMTIAPSSASNFIQEVSRFNNNVIKFSAKQKKSLIIKYHISSLNQKNMPSVAMAYTFFKTK